MESVWVDFVMMVFCESLGCFVTGGGGGGVESGQEILS